MRLNRSTALLAFLCLLAPSPSAAQHELESDAPAALEAALRITSLRGESAFLAGGMGLLGVRRAVRLGGAGWVLLGGTPVPSGSGTPDYELRFAYAGLVAEFTLLDTNEGEFSLRTLLGAGNAKVNSLPIVTTLVGADNFGVFEPEISGAWRLRGALHVTAAAGYRFTFGVEDLPGLSPSDLRGPSLRAGIVIRTY